MKATARVGAVLLIGLLGVGTWLSIKEAVVAVLWRGVSDYPRQWTDAPETLSVDSWGRSREFVDSALDWDPRDPQLLQTAGLIYWWGAWTNRDDPMISGPYMMQGLEHLRDATRMRPASPGAWADLALAKHRSGQWDEEFQYAYAMAWSHGGWFKSVILNAVELGFDAWSKFTPENRDYFYQALARAELRDKGWLWHLAGEKGKVFVLCLALHDSQPTRDWCRKQGYKL